jgi:hypothetical protein
MRVYDLEQGRSVERLNGHARIKTLPIKLFMPGQRVFTPRYRPFIPSSTNLPPAVILRLDRPLERTVGVAAVGCRVTKPGRGEESSGSKTSSVKPPRSSGFWLIRSWRKLRSRRSRMETSRPGTPAPDATSLSRLPSTIRMRRCGPGRAFSARVSQRPRRRLGSQSRENAMPLARTRASSMTGEHLIGEVSRLATGRDAFPAVLRCDKGLELGRRAMADWSSGQVGLHVIPPDCRGARAMSSRSTPASATSASTASGQRSSPARH